MSQLNKVLSTLSIASSDTRDDTIKSIVLNTLYESQQEISFGELVENISILYDVQLYEPELKEEIKILQDEGKVIIDQKGYRISTAEKGHLEGLESQSKIEERKRYLNFKIFLDDTFKGDLDSEEIQALWQSFREYLYNCFFHYGESAVNFFNPKANLEKDFENTDALQDVFKKLKNLKLQNALKRVIDDFSDYATQEDIDFINDLGQKTVCFASLGLEPDLAKEQINFSLVDWVLYLDTNFLFSILNLHVHVENEASKELIKLIYANPDFIKVQFRYSELTLKELKSKKSDFSGIVNDLTFTGIQALLESDELDAFSRRYYEQLIDKPGETLHPSEIIDFAEITLNTSHIMVSRNKRLVEHLGENYINAKVQDYVRFIEKQNEIRETYNETSGTKPIRTYYRTESQLFHDVTLREMIINSRDTIKLAHIQTLNDIKYFGITLDDLLIRFDSYEIGRSTAPYPTFFKPSFLLNKLVKILPVKTDNYKRAFIKAVSSRVFNKAPSRSSDIIKIVNYLKTLGIDDKKILLNLITEKLFVEKFKQSETRGEEEKKQFIESELNKIITKTNDDLSEAEKKIIVLKNQTEIDEEVKRKLTLEKDKYSEDVRLLTKAVSTLNKQVKKLDKQSSTDNRQGAFDFQETQREQLVEELNKKIKEELDRSNKLLKQIKSDDRKNYCQKILKKWRRNSWYTLFFSMFVFIIFFFICLKYSDWDMAKFEANIKTWEGHFFVSLAISFISLLFNLVIVAVLINKYYNHSNINAFIAKIEYPKDLQE